MICAPSNTKKAVAFKHHGLAFGFWGRSIPQAFNNVCNYVSNGFESGFRLLPTNPVAGQLAAGQEMLIPLVSPHFFKTKFKYLAHASFSVASSISQIEIGRSPFACVQKSFAGKQNQ